MSHTCAPHKLSLPVRSHARSVVVRAEARQAQPPAGVSTPTQLPVVPPPTFGFVNFAEKINGRACMIGFFALIIIEAITGQGLLASLGFRVGEGLPFEL